METLEKKLVAEKEPEKMSEDELIVFLATIDGVISEKKAEIHQLESEYKILEKQVQIKKEPKKEKKKVNYTGLIKERMEGFTKIALKLGVPLAVLTATPALDTLSTRNPEQIKEYNFPEKPKEPTPEELENKRFEELLGKIDMESYKKLSYEAKIFYLYIAENNKEYQGNWVLIDKERGWMYLFDTAGKIIKDHAVITGRVTENNENTVKQEGNPDINGTTPPCLTYMEKLDREFSDYEKKMFGERATIAYQLNLAGEQNIYMHDTLGKEDRREWEALQSPDSKERARSWGCIRNAWLSEDLKYFNEKTPIAVTPSKETVETIMNRADFGDERAKKYLEHNPSLNKGQKVDVWFDPESGTVSPIDAEGEKTRYQRYLTKIEEYATI